MSFVAFKKFLEDEKINITDNMANKLKEILEENERIRWLFHAL